MYKDFNTRLTKLQEIASKLEKRSSSSISDQKHTLRKLLQDSDNLERYYKDKEYREQLVSQAKYPSLEYVQFEKSPAISKTLSER
jgi:hypothetical protein